MKYIRDSIYTYIPVSDVESIILKQPEVLRLHRVLQNSTLFQTYPNNRATRFSHSLGAMHMAGLLLKTLIRNSRPEYVERLHQCVEKYLSKFGINEYLEAPRQYLIEQYVENRGIKEFYSNYGWSMRDEAQDWSNDNHKIDYYNTINNVIFQAIRLAALVHDIGHLPYSHVVEFALSDMACWAVDEGKSTLEAKDVIIKTKKLNDQFRAVILKGTELSESVAILKAKIHEQIGIVITDRIYERLKWHPNKNEFLFWEACWKTALRILSVDQLGHYLGSDFNSVMNDVNGEFDDLLVWYPLGNIINGPLDCDRLDYMRRDAYSSGFIEFSSFDSDRIVNSAVFLKPKAIGYLNENTAEKLMVVGFGRRSLSALADFFNDRVRQYRWLVNHHNVVRTDLALVRLLVKLYKLYKLKENPSLVECLDRNQFSQLWNWSSLERDLKYVDDSWLDELLHQVLKFFLINEHKLTPEEEDCLLYLEVFFDRNIENLFALWKRLDDFVPFADGFYDVINNNQRKIQKIIKQEDLTIVLNGKRNYTDATFLTNKIIEKWIYVNEKSKNSPYSLFTSIEQGINGIFDRRVTFAFKNIKPYEGVSIMLSSDLTLDGKTCYLDEMSSLVGHLNDISARDIKLYAYEIKKSNAEEDTRLKSKFWNESRLRQLGSIVANEMIKSLN